MCVQRRTHRGGGKKYRQQQFKPGEGWGSFHQSRRGLRADTHTHTLCWASSGATLYRHQGLAPDFLLQKGLASLSLHAAPISHYLPSCLFRCPACFCHPLPGPPHHLPAEVLQAPPPWPPCFLLPVLSPATQGPCQVSHICSEPSPAWHTHPCL